MAEQPFLARQIAEAASHADRATVLLMAPHAVLLAAPGPVADACRRAGFEIGADYVTAIVAMLLATRGQDGQVPDRHRATLDGLEAMLRRFLFDPDDALIAMQARHDAKAGRRNPDLVGTPAYDAAWNTVRQAWDEGRTDG